jgi:hypothetical protein
MLERRVHPRCHACLSSRPWNTLSSAPRPQRLATLVGGLAPGQARAGRPVGEHIHLCGDEAVDEVLNGDVALVAMMWVVMVLWPVLVSRNLVGDLGAHAGVQTKRTLLLLMSLCTTRGRPGIQEDLVALNVLVHHAWPGVLVYVLESTGRGLLQTMAKTTRSKRDQIARRHGI